MRRVLSLLVLLLPTSALAGGFSGKAGASVVELRSDGSALQLVVDVAGHADRVELWLSLDEDLPIEQVVGPHGERWLLDGRGDAAGLVRELRDPRIDGCTEDSPLTEERRIAREQLVGTPPAKLVTTLDFLGMVHLGFFPDGRPVMVYDRERYGAVGLGPIDSGIRYTARPTPSGWRLEARLAPEAFGFVPIGGVTSLRAQVDVFAGKRAPESTNRRRRWGRDEGFAKLRLDPPIAVALLPELPALGRPGVPAALVDGWPGLWAFTARGWQPVQREQLHPATEVARCELVLTRVTQVVAALLSVVPQPPKDPDGTGAAYFRVGERGLLVMNDTTVSADQLLQVFRYGDGGAGALVASVGSEGNPNGYCGGGLVVTLELIRLAGPPRRTSVAFVDGCRGFAGINRVRVEGVLDEIDEDARAIVSWKRRDSIVVTLPVDGGPKSWEIRWDRTGQPLPP